MSLVAAFLEARATLGLEDGPVDGAALKRAYRKKVLEHAPDRDPEGFRRVRDAFELLGDPRERAQAMLLGRLPALDPPAPPPLSPDAPMQSGAAALALLRALAGHLDAALLLTPERTAKKPAKKNPKGPKSP
jgi:curved DNA-binding protein CbpA